MNILDNNSVFCINKFDLRDKKLGQSEKIIIEEIADGKRQG